jgi:SAM-dependent methyltransferase
MPPIFNVDNDPMTHKDLKASVNVSTTSVQHLKTMLADEEYLRQRACPRPGDVLYLILADLLLALKRVDSSGAQTILDFGAGVAPYRSLFPDSDYRRADITADAEPEYLISDDGTLPERSAVFDLVLSTQVLEHVADPDTHLCECLRLLKPGGRLVVSTHGLFEDHGCPYDFQRWTADGLKRDLRKAGFEVLTMEKLTTGPRAIAFLMDRLLETVHTPKSSGPRFLYSRGKRLYRRSRRWLQIQLDRWCLGYRVVSSDDPSHILYVGLIACARRPQ